MVTDVLLVFIYNFFVEILINVRILVILSIGSVKMINNLMVDVVYFHILMMDFLDMVLLYFSNVIAGDVDFLSSVFLVGGLEHFVAHDFVFLVRTKIDLTVNAVLDNLMDRRIVSVLVAVAEEVLKMIVQIPNISMVISDVLKLNSMDAYFIVGNKEDVRSAFF